MRNASNAEIVRSLIQQFFNGHNPSVANEYFVPDFKWHGGSVGNYQGAENYAVAMTGFFRGLPRDLAFQDRVLAQTRAFLSSATALGPRPGHEKKKEEIRQDHSA